MAVGMGAGLAGLGTTCGRLWKVGMGVRTMRNKYGGNCCRCGKYVKPGYGYPELVDHSLGSEIYQGVEGKKWVVRCLDCKGKGHKAPPSQEKGSGVGAGVGTGVGTGVDAGTDVDRVDTGVGN